MSGRFRFTTRRAADPFEQEASMSELLAPAAAPLRPFPGMPETGQMHPAPTYTEFPAFTPAEQFPAAVNDTGPQPRRDTGPQRRLRPVPPLPPPPADVLGVPAQLPAIHLDPRTPISDDIARGWRYMYAIRCSYHAAPCATPIPCGTTHRDGGAMTFRALRVSAKEAGWHLDTLGRWVCPDCQMNPEYGTLYPVAVRTPQAPTDRERDQWPAWQRADDVTKWHLSIRADLGLRERTLRHWADSHRHGSHAAVPA